MMGWSESPRLSPADSGITAMGSQGVHGFVSSGRGQGEPMMMRDDGFSTIICVLCARLCVIYSTVGQGFLWMTL